MQPTWAPALECVALPVAQQSSLSDPDSSACPVLLKAETWGTPKNPVLESTLPHSHDNGHQILSFQPSNIILSVSTLPSPAKESKH